MSTTWSIDLHEWAERAKERLETVIRATSIELMSRIVLRTPVGNPDLWKANADVMRQRAQYNAEVLRTNSLLDAHPEWRLKYGNLRKRRTASAKTIAKKIPLRVGGGGKYTGGRLRGAWTVSLDVPRAKTFEEVVIDPSGGATIGDGIEVLTGYQPGMTIYVLNSMPYAGRVEYDGHSKQAPAGMVRVTIAELAGIVNEQVRLHSTESQ